MSGGVEGVYVGEAERDGVVGGLRVEKDRGDGRRGAGVGGGGCGQGDY